MDPPPGTFPNSSSLLFEVKFEGKSSSCKNDDSNKRARRKFFFEIKSSLLVTHRSGRRSAVQRLPGTQTRSHFLSQVSAVHYGVWRRS